MKQALNDMNKQELYYSGNLRRKQKIKALTHHHFVVPDCDDLGNLLTTYVFVQFVGVRMCDGFDHLLICKKCNEEAESLQQILINGKITADFLKAQKRKYCVHSRTLTTLDPESYFKLDENCFPWYFGSDLVDIEYIQEKPLLVAVLAGGQYGLVSLPTRARKYRCIYPHKESKVCCHVRTFENNEGSENQNEDILIQNTNDNFNILKDLPDLDINGEFRDTVKSKIKSFLPQRLDWPLNKSMKEKFRKMSGEGYNYDRLTNLVPKYDENKTCKCGHKFDPGCPIKSFWIQSKQVQLHNTEYVSKKPRTVYYRPTEELKCDHKDTWTGEDEMLLNIREELKKICKSISMQIYTFMQSILHFLSFA